MLNSLENVWPEWQIEERLGKGAYGEVYKVGRHDSGVDSYAAVKVITIPADDSEVESLKMDGFDMEKTRSFFQGIVDDFVNEIRLMETFKGVPNIVSVEDYKVIQKTNGIGWDIYIRMELLTPFNQYCSDRVLAEPDVIKLGIDICSALELCAQKGIIHRDIKPENIFVNDFGNFKLGDFGIARKLGDTTGGLSQKGTFNYMAPEVVNSTEYDARVDIYSLGIVLYRLLNDNRLPFLDSEAKLMNPTERKIAVERRLKGEALPAPSKASAPLANAVLRACAFRPNQRYKNASEMKAALTAVQNGSYVPVALVNEEKTEVLNAPNQTEAVGTFGTPRKKKSPVPVIIGIVCGLLILLAVGGFIAARKLLSNLAITAPETVAENTTIETESQKETKQETTMISEEDDAIQELLAEADELAKAGNYEEAVALLEKETKTYSRNQEFKNRLEGYKEELSKQQQKSSALAEAEDYAQKGDYSKAMSIIEDAKKTFGEDEELVQAYAGYEEAYIGEIREKALEEAQKFAEEEDYAMAYQTMEKAIKEIGEDSSLSSRAEEYEQQFVSAQIAMIDELLAENHYNEAVRIIENAQKVLPKNEALKEKKDEIEERKPVPITSLEALNGGFDWNNGNPTDPFGNTFSDVSNYAIFYGRWDTKNGYEEYRVYGKYSKLTGSLAPQENISEKGWGQIRIYADDVLLYTSPRVGRKTDVFDFSVDITGAEYVKIEWVAYDDSNGSNVFILMDVNLAK